MQNSKNEGVMPICAWCQIVKLWYNKLSIKLLILPLVCDTLWYNMKRDIDPQNKPKSEFIEYTKFKCYCKSGYSTLDKIVHNYITKKCICKKICKCKRYACTKIKHWYKSGILPSTNASARVAKLPSRVVKLASKTCDVESIIQYNRQRKLIANWLQIVFKCKQINSSVGNASCVKQIQVNNFDLKQQIYANFIDIR